VYSQIDALVVPSLWPENSPLVIHEAFMAGVPVVGSRIGGIPELVTDGVSGFVFESGSAADLARALRRFIDRPQLVAELAAGAPPVKTMAEDADEWDATYSRMGGAKVGSA
jgi:glycosyltransferase involved in cell wall biosynthesis